MNQTLEQFLRNLKKEDDTTYEVSFKIRECNETEVVVMLHPKDKDGDTVDFIVKGNYLIPRYKQGVQ